MTFLAELVAPLGDIDKVEKAKPAMRLIAITHGDPTATGHCGRPITYRATRVTEKRSADRIAVCPLHGDLLEDDPKTGGYRGAFAFFADDTRPRRRSE